MYIIMYIPHSPVQLLYFDLDIDSGGDDDFDSHPTLSMKVDSSRVGRVIGMFRYSVSAVMLELHSYF